MRRANPFDFHYICLLPTALNIDQLLQEKAILVKNHKSNPSKIRDRLAYVINALVRSTNKLLSEGEITDRNEYGRICSKPLQAVIKDYNLYLNYLVENRVIEKGADGEKNKNCTEYRFTPYYRNDEFRSYTILDTGFLNVIFSKKRDKKTLEKYRKQYQWLQKVEVDWNHAFQILELIYGSNTEMKKDQIERLKAIEDIRIATFHTGRTNRLYTPICNLHNQLRPALTIDGKRLVEVDIRNSIPFFSTTLFTSKLYEQGLDKVLLEINPRLGDGEGKLHPWLMLVDIIASPSKYPDVNRYSALCRSGKLYELLAEKWSLIPGKKYNRDKAKKKLMKIFNSPPAFASKEKDVLLDLFPNVVKAIEEINEGYYKTNGGKGKAKWREGDQVCPFAHVTQRCEARVLLDVICRRLEREYPDIPFLTLHDCILTTIGNEELVQMIMVEEIMKIMGYPPVIKNKVL